MTTAQALLFALAIAGPMGPIGEPNHVPVLIDAAALEYGIAPAQLRQLAWCESSWRPWVTSPAGDRGLMQFAVGRGDTWPRAVALARLPANASPYDPWHASLATAALLVNGEARRWPVCARRAGLL